MHMLSQRSHWLTGCLLLITLTGMAQALTRAPYLQTVTSTGITIRWRTDQPSDSRVRFGTSFGQLTQQTTNPAQTTEHIVTLTNLQPATHYYYAIGSSANDILVSEELYFKTSPVPGSTAPFRIWALGDFGAGSANQMDVAQRYRQVAQNRPADVWLWLGDNAYNQGYDWQYQQNVFTMYTDILKHLPFWPTPGNHDYADTPTNPNIEYFNLITVPQQAEVGGVPSGSKMNYSFNYANVHFVSLDSEGQDDKRLYDTTGRQVQWLKQDLAANKLPWTIVFFHHPPYSKGSHDTNNSLELTLIRQQLTPILERYNVDLVLCGHSHVYERSYLMKGHTGLSNTFNVNQHAVSTSTARYDGSPNSCPITNKTSGVIYVVNGSGGQLGGQAAGYPHPAMIYSNNTIGGSMLIDVNNNRLDAQWLAADGTSKDKFTLFKNVGKRYYLFTTPATSQTLTASWPGNYVWSGNQTSRTINVAPTTPTSYTVTDSFGCLTDVFTIDMDNTTDSNLTFAGEMTIDEGKEPATVRISLPANQTVDLHVTDSQGLVLFEKQYPNTSQIQETVSLPNPGRYWFTARVGTQLIGRISFVK
ncbi:metallophosphoesterase family protein [Spirosoma sp. BT702]|uniref:Metallophosphoesterase family protein n=1 Tax=Spirosoma profusum TaxID=2771354 RepID=A0A927G9R0_9BACT|nr:metallophosphoesterase family protein [Spirosoma profusum]MBD2704886.1 metallophosphoesterase family protein [Spirosoma profusum]